MLSFFGFPSLVKDIYEARAGKANSHPLKHSYNVECFNVSRVARKATLKSMYRSSPKSHS